MYERMNKWFHHANSFCFSGPCEDRMKCAHPPKKNISICFTFNKYKGKFSRNVSLNVLWYRISIIQMNNGIIKQYDLFLFLFVNIQLKLFSLSNIHVPLPANGSLVVGKRHFTSHETHLLTLGSVWLELLLIRGSGGENRSVEEAMKQSLKSETEV